MSQVTLLSADTVNSVFTEELSHNLVTSQPLPLKSTGSVRSMSCYSHPRPSTFTLTLLPPTRPSPTTLHSDRQFKEDVHVTPEIVTTEIDQVDGERWEQAATGITGMS